MNFTRKTSWHLEIFVCERSTILFYITFVFPCCKENWMKYDSTSREIIRYHILSFTYKFCPRILRKTFSETSCLSKNIMFYRKRKHKDKNIFWTNALSNTFTWDSFLVKLSKLIESRSNAILIRLIIHIDTKIWETPYEF